MSPQLSLPVDSEPRLVRRRAGVVLAARIARVAWAKRRGHFSVLFLALGVSLMMAYVRVTPYDQRSHDVFSHIEYMDHLRDDETVPDARACWECHQPPAYYVLADGVLALFHSKPPPIESGPHAARGGRILQRLSVILAAGMLFSWLLTIERVLASPYERVVASALVTFWPTAIIETCKLGNDTLGGLLVSLTVWQLVVWSQDGGARPLVLAGIAAGLSVNAKVSGLVAVGLVLACLGARFVWPPTGQGEGQRRWPRGTLAVLSAMMALLGVAAWTVIHWKHGEYRPTPPEPEKLSPAHFFHIDLEAFAASPFVQWGLPGRDEFWSFLFRSSLFGGFSSDDPTTRVLAFTMLGLGLVFAAFLLSGLAMSVRRALRRDDGGFRVIVLSWLGLLAFVVYARTAFPWPPHNDFRLSLPLLLPSGVMFGLAAGRWHRSFARWQHTAALPGFLVAMFCLLAVKIVLFW